MYSEFLLGPEQAPKEREYIDNIFGGSDASYIIDSIRKVLCEVFDAHCNSGLYTL